MTGAGRSARWNATGAVGGVEARLVSRRSRRRPLVPSLRSSRARCRPYFLTLHFSDCRKLACVFVTVWVSISLACLAQFNLYASRTRSLNYDTIILSSLVVPTLNLVAYHVICC